MSKKQPDIDKQIEGKLLRLIPGFHSFAERFIKRVESFDGTAPQTLIADIRRDFETLATTLNGKERILWRLISSLLRSKWLQEELRSSMLMMIRSIKQQAALDPRYTLILKLIHTVDEQAPSLSLFANLLPHGNPERLLAPQCRPVPFLQRAKSQSGEVRALAILDALGHTVVGLYEPYVTTLWRLSYLKNGEIPPHDPPKFGHLLKVTAQKLPDYQGIIDLDAGWMRNSVYHGRYVYDVKDDVLIMSDENHPETRVPVDVLIAKVESLYLISGQTIAHVARLYLCREFLVNTGLWATLIDCLPLAFSGDRAKLDVAEKKLVAKALAIAAPVQTFFQSNGVQLT
jgi:hypothetical protein